MGDAKLLRNGAAVGLMVAAIAHYFIWYGAKRAEMPFDVNWVFAIGLVIIFAAAFLILGRLGRLLDRLQDRR